MPNELILLGGALMFALFYALFVIPFVHKWRVGKNVGVRHDWLLLFILHSVRVDEHALHLPKTLAWATAVDVCCCCIVHYKDLAYSFARSKLPSNAFASARAASSAFRGCPPRSNNLIQ